MTVSNVGLWMTIELTLSTTTVTLIDNKEQILLQPTVLSTMTLSMKVPRMSAEASRPTLPNWVNPKSQELFHNDHGISVEADVAILQDGFAQQPYSTVIT